MARQEGGVEPGEAADGMRRNTTRATDGGRRGSSGEGIDTTQKEKKPNPLAALVDKLGLDMPTLTTMFK
jgi:hypothetical protein